MKRVFEQIFLISVLLMLLACSQQPQIQYVPVPVPQPVLVPQAVPVTYEPPKATGAQNVPALPQLQAIDLKVFAYGATETMSAKPGTPLEYRLRLKTASAGSQPLTNAYDPSILLMEIFNDGTYQLYGTSNIKDIIPSNVIRYNPTTETWTTDRGVAQGSIATQRLFAVVTFNGKTLLIQKALNVR